MAAVPHNYTKPNGAKCARAVFNLAPGGACRTKRRGPGGRGGPGVQRLGGMFLVGALIMHTRTWAVGAGPGVAVGNGAGAACCFKARARAHYQPTVRQRVKIL